MKRSWEVDTSRGRRSDESLVELETDQSEEGALMCMALEILPTLGWIDKDELGPSAVVVRQWADNIFNNGRLDVEAKDGTRLEVKVTNRRGTGFARLEFELSRQLSGEDDGPLVSGKVSFGRKSLEGHPKNREERARLRREQPFVFDDVDFYVHGVHDGESVMLWLNFDVDSGAHLDVVADGQMIREEPIFADGKWIYGLDESVEMLRGVGLNLDFAALDRHLRSGDTAWLTEMVNGLATVGDYEANNLAELVTVVNRKLSDLN